jgi:hypothetical protein
LRNGKIIKRFTKKAPALWISEAEVVRILLYFGVSLLYAVHLLARVKY